MADLMTVVNEMFLSDEELRQGIELLFYGYRDFTAEADASLATLGLGRAHHRAIYFIGRHPGLTVSQLLAVLKITKQSLSRVLQDLVGKGYVAQQAGATDRRQRHLRLTAKGQMLEHSLTEAQRRRIAQAYERAGGAAVAGFRRVMFELINDVDRARLDRGPRPGTAAAE